MCFLRTYATKSSLDVSEGRGRARSRGVAQRATRAHNADALIRFQFYRASLSPLGSQGRSATLKRSPGFESLITRDQSAPEGPMIGKDRTRSGGSASRQTSRLPKSGNAGHAVRIRVNRAIREFRSRLMTSEDATHFTSVDQTADPGFFIHFLDEANKLPDASAWKPIILPRRPSPQAWRSGAGFGLRRG
jgi:hypothetical protein